MQNKMLDRDLNRDAFRQVLSKGYDEMQDSKSELDINNFAPASEEVKPVEGDATPAPEGEDTTTPPAEEKTEETPAPEGDKKPEGEETTPAPEATDDKSGENIEEEPEELLNMVKSLLGIVDEQSQTPEIDAQATAVDNAAKAVEAKPEDTTLADKLQDEINKLNELMLQKEVKSEQDAREKERYKAELDSKNEELDKLNAELTTSRESANLLDSDDRVKSLAMFMTQYKAGDESVKDDIQSIVGELVQEIYGVNMDDMMKSMAEKQS
jgi:hypothetical protein